MELYRIFVIFTEGKKEKHERMEEEKRKMKELEKTREEIDPEEKRINAQIENTILKSLRENYFNNLKNSSVSKMSYN